jgi:hypothetical protein
VIWKSTHIQPHFFLLKELNCLLLDDGHLRETREGRAAVRALVLDGDVSSVLRHAILKSHGEALDADGLGTGLAAIASHVLVEAQLTVNPISLLISYLAQPATMNESCMGDVSSHCMEPVRQHGDCHEVLVEQHRLVDLRKR